ncbi:hypothetical protein JKP88DRAFT_310577 [Tribonema minus]|uniref:Uncharacterized protein n=1 Tax=Tribonema minus TaxID=303371 RepID=A0A835Z9I5_9STRA|nr:hypothetical protein JKP88DRAFT_310577 [Tribonema minus]
MQKLTISGFGAEIPNGVLPKLLNLGWEEVILSSLTDEELPAMGLTRSTLKTLQVVGCNTLTNLEELTNNLVKLKKLTVNQCDAVTELPSLRNLPALHKLDLRYCPKLEKLPDTTMALLMRGNVLLDGRLVANYNGEYSQNALEGALVASTLLATLGFTALANPTDWNVYPTPDISHRDGVQESFLVRAASAQAFFCCAQISFFASLTALVVCLCTLMLRARMGVLVQRSLAGVDLQYALQNIAVPWVSGLLLIGVASIASAILCACMMGLSLLWLRIVPFACVLLGGLIVLGFFHELFVFKRFEDRV